MSHTSRVIHAYIHYMYIQRDFARQVHYTQMDCLKLYGTQILIPGDTDQFHTNCSPLLDQHVLEVAHNDQQLVESYCVLLPLPQHLH